MEGQATALSTQIITAHDEDTLSNDKVDTVHGNSSVKFKSEISNYPQTKKSIFTTIRFILSTFSHEKHFTAVKADSLYSGPQPLWDQGLAPLRQSSA